MAGACTAVLLASTGYLAPSRQSILDVFPCRCCLQVLFLARGLREIWQSDEGGELRKDRESATHSVVFLILRIYFRDL